MELSQRLINKSFEHYQFKLIIMSDLTTLFTMPAAPLRQTTSPVQLASSRKQDSLAPHLNSVSSSPWNIADLESTLRKTIKEKMDSSNLAEELQKFTAVQSTLLSSTVIAFFACILAVSLVVELDHRVAFHLFLAFAVQLLPTLAFSPAQETVIRHSLRIINPMVYATLCYYLLKNLAGVDMDTPHYPLTFTTLVITSLHITLSYFQPVFAHEVDHIFFLQLRAKTFLQRLSLWPLFFWAKMTFLYKIKNYLLNATLVTSTLLIMACLFLKNYEMLSSLYVKYWIFSLLVFILVETFLQICRLLPYLFSRQLRTLKDKMPIILSLLRLLPRNAYTQLVHKKCLQSLYQRMQNRLCFLSTETCKSLIFENYMDLFNCYAVKELQEMHSMLNLLLTATEQNRRVYKSPKGMQKDLFMPIKRAAAMVSQFHSLLSTLHLLSEVKLLISIIGLADEQAFREKDAVRVSGRIVELLQMMQSKINRIQDASIVSSILNAELQVCEREVKGMVYSMRKGWV